MTIQLSDLAQADLEEIHNFTVKTWGKAQWLTYYRQIVEAFWPIEENPEIGTDRSLFVPDMRSINCRQHVIFFKCLDAADGAPVVLRIIHGRRHMTAFVYHDDLSGV